MAGHFNEPAQGVVEREDKCKFEREQSGHFSSHNSCRTAQRRRGLVFGLAMMRRKIKRTGSGTHHDSMATHAHTSGAGRFEEPCQGISAKAEGLKTCLEPLSTNIRQHSANAQKYGGGRRK